MTTPRISVCLTHFERPEKLDSTLESLADQTLLPDELFLWDDCSQNDPSAVVKRWEGRFPHFVYYRNSANLGMPGNLNAVIAQATGDYVANLHDADVFSPSLLKRWAEALDNHPKAGLVFCADSRGDNPLFERCWSQPNEITSGRDFFKRYYLGRVDSIIWGTVMMRRTVYADLLPFKNEYKNWADVDMWMRACKWGDIAYVNEKLITLDNTPTSLRRFSFAREAVIQRMIKSNIDSLFVGAERINSHKVQDATWRRCWLRWMAGGVRHREWARLIEGFRYFSVKV